MSGLGTGLSVARRPGIALVTLSRPETGNALDLRLADELARAVRLAESDDDCRCLVIAAEGKLFCGGGDVRAMAAADRPDDYLADLVGRINVVVRALAATRLAVVNAVQGSVAGAGLVFPLLSDVVVAAAEAGFSSGYLGVGLSPDCGVSYFLPRTVGERRAAHFVLSGERVTASQAAEWGLVDEVVPRDQVRARALAAAERIAVQLGPALGEARRLLRGVDAASLEEQLERERVAVSRLAGTPEAQVRFRQFARV